MHYDQLLADLVEHTNRSRAAADDGAAAPLQRDRAAEDELRAIEVATGVTRTLGDRASGIHEPAPLDDRLLAAGADDGCVRALPEQQPERGHHHRLARTRLARDGSEARAERQAGIADHAEGADPDLLDHERAASSLSGPRHPDTERLNLLTSLSTNGPCESRASRTGVGERRTTTRAPGGRSKVRRPSQ